MITNILFLELSKGSFSKGLIIKKIKASCNDANVILVVFFSKGPGIAGQLFKTMQFLTEFILGLFIYPDSFMLMINSEKKFFFNSDIGKVKHALESFLSIVQLLDSIECI